MQDFLEVLNHGCKKFKEKFVFDTNLVAKNRFTLIYIHWQSLKNSNTL